MAVFRVEKTRDFTIMSNHHLRNKTLSLKAKGLQSLMLSLPENWDFTTKGLAHICKDGVDAITNALVELEENGYLTRQRMRDERGRLGDVEYTIHEQPANSESGENEPISPKRENPRLDNPRQENPVLGKPEQAKPVLENHAQYSTKESNTQESKKEKSRTDLSIHPSMDADAVLPKPAPTSCARSKPTRVYEKGITEQYRLLVLENIGYDSLSLQYGCERMDAVAELMLEMLLSKRDYIRIAGDEFPATVVRNRMLKVNSQHIQYVFDAMDKHTGKIRNIKAYLLTALYNAPVTCDQYYRAEVNHDIYGSQIKGGDDIDLLFDIY